MTNDPDDLHWMLRACELARQGEGFVEPNPMVGCVLVKNGQLIAEGFHQRFGGPHAEREALSQLASRSLAQGATAYVTLEPCCHFGKTPPCTEALIQAGVARVCCAIQDPYPQVAGQGIEQLRAAGIKVDVGLGQEKALEILAPYLKRVRTQKPWVIAKWAMSLDGRMATRTGDSRWISSEESRRHAHQQRGKVDAIIIGSRTAALDDPLLTARPPGPRTPMRVVIDSKASLSESSQLVQTARDVPVLVWTHRSADESKCQRLQAHGCLVERFEGEGHGLEQLLNLLTQRWSATNVIVEGGGQLLGHFHDAQLIDELHCYMAPKIIGGRGAISPLSGIGLETVADGPKIDILQHECFSGDLFVRARIRKADV